MRTVQKILSNLNLLEFDKPKVLFLFYGYLQIFDEPRLHRLKMQGKIPEACFLLEFEIVNLLTHLSIDIRLRHQSQFYGSTLNSYYGKSRSASDLIIVKSLRFKDRLKFLNNYI
jgi:hypothetical protein